MSSSGKKIASNKSKTKKANVPAQTQPTHLVYPPSGYRDVRPQNQQQIILPQHEYGYVPYQPVQYTHPYPHHIPPPPHQQPYYHSTAPQQYYHQPVSHQVSAYEDHAAFMSLMTQGDQPQHHYSAKQLDSRDRDVMKNLGRQFSSAGKTIPTNHDVEEVSTDDDQVDAQMEALEEENDAEDNEEDTEQTQATQSPEYNKKKTKWKKLSGIFDSFGRGSTPNQILQLEDVEVADDEAEPSDGKKKQVKFTSHQYLSLAKSWLRISTDSITGNNMKGEKFWQKVADFYNTLEPVKRSWASCRGGYRVMNPACQNYLAILSRLEHRQQSGAAPSDIIVDARKVYQEKYGHPFKFQECFEVLSSLRKWKHPNEPVHVEQQNKARRMNYSDSSPGSDPCSQERSPLFGNADGRPVGRNKSIQNEQRNAEFAKFMESQDKFISETRESRRVFQESRVQSSNEFQQMMVQAEARKEARLREKNRIKLITCDFSKLSPLQQELLNVELESYRSERGSGGSGTSRDGY